MATGRSFRARKGADTVSECLLRKANGQTDVECDEERCTYWRIVEQAGVPTEPEWNGCAIQHFELLDGGAGVVAWLMSVKERVEGTIAEQSAQVVPETTEVIDPRD